MPFNLNQTLTELNYLWQSDSFLVKPLLALEIVFKPGSVAVTEPDAMHPGLVEIQWLQGRRKRKESQTSMLV